MIYRVTLKESGVEMRFDFLTAIDALTFMDAAVQNHVDIAVTMHIESTNYEGFEAYLSMR